MGDDYLEYKDYHKWRCTMNRTYVLIWLNRHYRNLIDTPNLDPHQEQQLCSRISSLSVNTSGRVNKTSSNGTTGALVDNDDSGTIKDYEECSDSEENSNEDKFHYCRKRKGECERSSNEPANKKRRHF